MISVRNLNFKLGLLIEIWLAFQEEDTFSIYQYFSRTATTFTG